MTPDTMLAELAKDEGACTTCKGTSYGSADTNSNYGVTLDWSPCKHCEGTGRVPLHPWARVDYTCAWCGNSRETYLGEHHYIACDEKYHDGWRTRTLDEIRLEDVLVAEKLDLEHQGEGFPGLWCAINREDDSPEVVERYFFGDTPTEAAIAAVHAAREVTA